MSDLVYLLLTLVSFAGFALLVGVIDGHLPPPDGSEEAAPVEPEPAEVRR